MVCTEGTEYYTYDRLDQLKTLQRGMDNEAWNYDPTGNWLAYTKNGLTQNRTHNAGNEILTMTLPIFVSYETVYDRNGNTTRMRKPDGTGYLDCSYDAWNRLVVAGLHHYVYDGLNRRIKKSLRQIVTRSFFNANWQELESRTGEDVTTYVWGLRYVDDLVSREKDEVRLYALQDANWNVVALTDVDGAVVERYTYDGFGKRNVFDANGTSLSASVYGFDRAFTGQVLDEVTGLMCYRNRYYHVDLGRFVTRDPIGYMAGDPNLYRYVANRSTRFLDPKGLQDWGVMFEGMGMSANDVPASQIKQLPVWNTLSYVQHYNNNKGEPVDLNDLPYYTITHMDLYARTPQVQAVVNEFKKTAKDVAERESGQCLPTQQIVVKDSQDVASVARQNPDLFSIGKSHLIMEAVITLSCERPQCDACKCEYTSKYTFSIKDAFEDPLDISVEIPGSTPYRIYGTWYENK